MGIFVKAKPKAKQERIEKIDNTHFVVAVKGSPKQGRVRVMFCFFTLYKLGWISGEEVKA